MILTLQSLRIVFVMMIFMSHFVYQGMGAFDAGGDGGVAFFFILSGFVLSLGYGKRISQGTFNFRDFMRRRLVKLYPLHLLLLLVYLVVSRSGVSLPIVLNALLLQCWVPLRDYYFSGNSVSWFLSCMLFCYLVFPWLYRHASRSLLVLVLSLYAVLYFLVPYDYVNNILYVNPLVRTVDFLLGIMLCRFYEKHDNCLLPSWSEPLSVFFVVVTFVAYPYVDEKFRNAPMFWLSLLPFIFVFAYGKGLMSQWLSTRPMQVLGALSMPVFLIHPMTMGFLIRHLPTMPYGIMLTICVVVVLLLSACINRWFIKPIEKLWK